MSKLIFNHLTYAKTATYCAMHFIVAITIAYLISGSWIIALSIGTLEPLVQTFCYNLHERGWNKAQRRHMSRVMDTGLANAAI